LDMQFKNFVRIAMVRMNHEVGTHFIQREYNFADNKLGDAMILQGAPDKIPNTLQIFYTAPDFVLIIHRPSALLQPCLSRFSKVRSTPESRRYLQPSHSCQKAPSGCFCL